MAQCTAHTRTGAQCKSNAVTGYSVCRMHGAGSPKAGRPGGRPIVTGRYSIKRHELAENYQAFLDDPAPANLMAELATQRALLQMYMSRFDDSAVRMTADDISRLFEWMESISKLVERIAKLMSGATLTHADIAALQTRMMVLLPEYIPDAERRTDFLRQLFGAIATAATRDESRLAIIDSTIAGSE